MILRMSMLACILVLILCGCQYTSCTFTSVKLVAGGEMTADVRQVPVDKSVETSSPTTATHTVSPTTSVSGLPGM